MYTTQGEQFSNLLDLARRFQLSIRASCQQNGRALFPASCYKVGHKKRSCLKLDYRGSLAEIAGMVAVGKSVADDQPQPPSRLTNTARGQVEW